ncbi:MAG: LamG domain-containing protein [Planctomycetota bacterium]|jgi:hypothetical protein
MEKTPKSTRDFLGKKPVGWWKFDSNSGTTAYDSAGENNGTIHGATWAAGKIGSALSFDGNDYVDIGAIADLGVEQTRMLWVYLKSYPSQHGTYLIDQGKNRNNNNWIELIDTNDNGIPTVRTGFDAANHFDSNGEIKKESWYHIAVVSSSSGDIAIYINGALDSTASGFSTATKPEGTVIGAGSKTKTLCFKGIIDDVRIYDYPLSQKEIAAIYAGKKTNFIPVLVIFLIVAAAVVLARCRKKQ